jgi:hypothetical protein
MSLTIELDPAVEARLAAAAREAGMAPEDLANRVLAQHLPALDAGLLEDPTLALFRQWEAEDALRTPDESVRERELWEQFQTNVNTTRDSLGMRRL